MPASRSRTATILPRRPEPHFLLERSGRVEVEHAVAHFVVERWIDAVADQNREADILERAREFGGEPRLVFRVAAKEGLEINNPLCAVAKVQPQCIARTPARRELC